MATDDALLAHDRAAEEYIVDGDFHLQMPVERLYPYVEDPMIREKLEANGPPPFGTSHKHGGFSKQPGDDTDVEWIRAMGIAYETDEIAEVMDRMGLDAVVVTPGTNMPLGSAIYPRVSNALARAYNDYLLHEVIDVEAGIYGAVFVPDWDVNAALEELDRVGEEAGFVGAANWMKVDHLWGDYKFDPIFERLTSLDLPLLLHIISQSRGPQLIRDSMAGVQTEKLIAADGYKLLATVGNLVMSGVFDAHPSLNVVLQEAGASWVPYVAWRADDMYQAYPEDLQLAERFHDRGERYLERLPSEYILEHMYTTTQPMSLQNVRPRSHFGPLLELCHAEEMFIYSSDFPHPTTDPVHWLFDEPIDDDLRARIAHGNAEDVLRFPN